MYLQQSATEKYTNNITRPHTTHASFFSLLYLREMSEALLGLTTLLALGWFLPTMLPPTLFIFFLFLVVVIAIAIRYHRPAAYTTGVLAALSQTALLWHSHLLSLSNFHVLTGPFILLLSGFIISDLLQTQRKRFEEAQEFSKATDKQLQETTQRYQQALTVNTELEQQIAGQTTSLLTVSEKMNHLLTAQGNDRYQAVTELVQHTLEAQSCSLYLHIHGQMQLCAGLPQASSEHNATLDMQSPMVRRVLSKQAVVTIRELLPTDMQPGQKSPIMAGPILDQHGQVAALVVIENMPLLKCTSGAEQLFGSLLHLASGALLTTLAAESEDEETAAYPVLVG